LFRINYSAIRGARIDYFLNFRYRSRWFESGLGSETGGEAAIFVESEFTFGFVKMAVNREMSLQGRGRYFDPGRLCWR
jgi:hypothetical protein